MSTTLDPVDYAVISQALIAVAREMGAKLIRSAYSNIVREARDASAGLFDRDGNVVAQAELIPMQLGPIGEIFRACLKRHPVETLKEGDFFINNDPYDGGQHLQDVFIFTPIFVEGRVVGFAGSVAHHLDLGGGAPGLTSDAVDVYQEGMSIPPSRYNFAARLERRPLRAAGRRQRARARPDDRRLQRPVRGQRDRRARVKQLCERYGADEVERR